MSSLLPNRRRPVYSTTLLLGALALSVLSVPAMAVDEAATITVVFTEDDMGFTATSTKDISNIIVELCDGSIHKHDDLEGNVFVHTETQPIVGVWVKSGNNGIGGDAPSGAGERFDNDDVDCGPTEIPVFPSTAALAIGTTGALLGSVLIFRRRKA